MKLDAYVIDDFPLEIRPAPTSRPWLETLANKYGYRCLPLTMANAFGWEILCPSTFMAAWDGNILKESIKIIGGDKFATSHFGYGILTMHVGAILRTEPGYDLLVTGPINNPKDGIQPLSGIVETEWSPYSFTMNWCFTNVGRPIRFEKGEPYCHIIPVKRGELESFKPTIKKLSDNPELEKEFKAWGKSRLEFNDGLMSKDVAPNEQWQKHYYLGKSFMTEDRFKDHVNKLRLKEFKNDRN